MKIPILVSINEVLCHTYKDKYQHLTPISDQLRRDLVGHVEVSAVPEKHLRYLYNNPNGE